MSERPPRIERHEAYDRIGKIVWQTAHALGEADGAGEPIVVRTDGPHRSIDGLAALIDEALADEPPGTAVDDRRKPRDDGDAAGT